MQKTLFEAIKVGELTLKNRILMSPLTRCRADPKTCVPTDIMATYYKQRSGFGLLIAEATGISQSALAFNGGPAIFNQEQANGWKNVVDQVHENNGLIMMQLWHGGRAANQNITQQELIAPSAIAIRGENKSTGKNYLIPREMTLEDMKQVISDYKKAAEYCKQAGFDGVQVHCANGYLLDEFLRDGSNQRKDEYGGSFENRTRFPLQVIDEVMKVYSPGRICVRVSPVGRSNDMYDSDPVNLYSYFLQQLDKRKLAFVEIREFDNVSLFDQYWPQKGIEQCKDLNKVLYKNFTSGGVAVNQGVTYDSALDKITKGECDLVSFGKFSISNPDLPERLKNKWALTPFDMSTFYSPGPKGYTDYLTYQEQEEQKKKQEAESVQN